MSSKKDTRDPRRVNLVVPYKHPAPAKDSATTSSTVATIMPMAAMMTRNRVMGCVMSWLGESEETRQNSSTPGYFTVGMSVMSLLVTYLPLFLPPPSARTGAPSAGTPVPVPVA